MSTITLTLIKQLKCVRPKYFLTILNFNVKVYCYSDYTIKTNLI